MAETTAGKLVEEAASGAANTTEAAHKAAAGIAVGLLEQVKDLLGVAGFVAAVGDKHVNDLIEEVQAFVATGERPARS